ncbi:MAG: hypothetical protein FJY85_07365 [Deltaproteobacteria bacterium]|nr:hypothetical protein [Deltaproteobacteria bacterium]
MNRSDSFLPFIDVLTGLVGLAIFINIILALDMSESDKIPVRVMLREEGAPQRTKERRPVYVICDGAGISVGDTVLPVPKSYEENNRLENAIQKEVERVGESGHVLALIRPEGYRAFEAVRRTVDRLGFRLGYEPVTSDWEIVKQ